MMDGSDHTGIKCHCKVLTLNERGSCCKILKRELISLALQSNHSTSAAMLRTDWMGGKGGNGETN